jgi:tripartite-type tricarboxylate transporter receptor subunit TctC
MPRVIGARRWHSVVLRAAATCVAVVVSLLSAVAQDASWPGKPIKIIVPYAPGGAVDATARLLQEALADDLGQPILIENRAGGAGVPASEALVRAAPDGYTLGLFASAWAANATLQKNLSFDPVKDITPITVVANSTTLVLVHPISPIKSLRQLVAEAQAKPGQIPFASSGVGTAQHFAAELFKLRAKVDMLHVPYRGAGPALNDALGGQVQVSFLGIGPTKPHVEAGRLRALAITTGARSKILPDVPTVAEQGYAGFDHGEWFGIIAPAALPPEITSRLHAAVVRVVKSAKFGEKLALLGIEPVSQSPAEFAAFIGREIERLRVIIQETRMVVQ